MHRAAAVSVLLVVGACGRSAEQPVPSWDAGASAPPASAASPSAPVVTASAVASASAVPTPLATAPVDAGSCAYDPKDLPEPVAPRLECIFEREVRCVPGAPTLAAWQRWFPFCPLTGKSFVDTAVKSEARFSAKETCARRDASAQCCYVQFSATTCR